jgi:2-isopropylmalate synthase
MSDNRVYIYDVTLRDGAQTQGVDFSAQDKIVIAGILDSIGIDYIEGGWPGANPTDDAFFANLPALKKSQYAAFGMTRRNGRSAENDPGLNALLGVDTPMICMVGKTWDFHVDVALEIERTENIAMISDSIKIVSERGKQALFDAEHFFDGYKNNPDYAMACITAAYEAGARWVVLCDTNGGTLPHEIETIVAQVCTVIPGNHVGIHCHDDTANAVANSLAAVRAGARQVQGAMNGLGERCGNANLVTIIPTLMLKMGYDIGITHEQLKKLTHASHVVDERLGRSPNKSAPYVGSSAFAHKGGLHVSAVEKDPRTYEHVEPDSVGNVRHVVVSDQAGRANILARFREIGIEVDAKDPRLTRLVELVKEREFKGYAYDGAEASFELLARRELGKIPDYFHCKSFRVIDDRRWNTKGDLITMSEATVKLVVDGQEHMTVAEGNGPVNALDAALRKVLLPRYPVLAGLSLSDFKVRILTPGDGTGAITRVMIETTDTNGRSDSSVKSWNTIGVSPNIIDASYNALRDSLIFKLFREKIAL